MLKLKTDKSRLRKIIQDAGRYVSDGKNLEPHFAHILVESDKESNTLVVTSEGESGALSFAVSEGVEILGDGKLLLRPRHTLTALDALVGEDDEVEVIQTKSSLRLHSASADSEVPYTAIKSLANPEHLPAVQEIEGEARSFVLGAYDFRSAAHIASVNVVAASTRPILRDIDISFDPESNTMMCSGANPASFSRQKKSVERSSGKPFHALVPPSEVAKAGQYIDAGSKVEIAVEDLNDYDAEGPRFLSIRVLSESDEVTHRITINLVRYIRYNFPSAIVEKSVCAAIAPDTTTVVTANRSDLHELFIAAARMASLVPEQTGGGAVNLLLDISPDNISVGISGTEQVRFDATIDTKRFVRRIFDEASGLYELSDEPLRLMMPWGVNAEPFASFPTEGDEIGMAIIAWNSEVSQRIVPLFDPSLKDGWDPERILANLTVNPEEKLTSLDFGEHPVISLILKDRDKMDREKE